MLSPIPPLNRHLLEADTWNDIRGFSDYWIIHEIPDHLEWYDRIIEEKGATQMSQSMVHRLHWNQHERWIQGVTQVIRLASRCRWHVRDTIEHIVVIFNTCL